MVRLLRFGVCAALACVLLAAPCLRAADKDVHKAVQNLAGSAKARKDALQVIGHSRDVRLIAFLDDYLKGNIYQLKDQVALVTAAIEKKKPVPLLDPVTREPLLKDGAPLTAKPDDLEEVSPAGRERGLIRELQSLLALGSPDTDLRLQAVNRCGESSAENNPYLAEQSPEILAEMLDSEKESHVRAAIEESILLLKLNHPEDKAAFAEAAEKLGSLASSRARPKMEKVLAANPDAQTTEILKKAIARIEQWEGVCRGVGYVFSGLSLGSVLVLMALGLSIIFGLMGVINMAHGELMMIGAYATFLTQKAFERWMPPGAFDWYFIAAIPLSFVAAAFVGYLIEVLVVRHLYSRPLDTLLATWGISLLLVQTVRLVFGDNIAVNSPSWLQGGSEFVQGIVLPYNRLFIMVFCGLCIGLMYYIVGRTKLGLLLRATSQNRNMAASLGVRTRRIDGYTFALGAGLAGLAGCALTQIGGVTPDMGNNYIVDSFMVVVMGGVGKLAGAIMAGLGLGMLNKIFEPFTGAVWAKVMILVVVVVFLQWRPSGLFPAKGRFADA